MVTEDMVTVLGATISVCEDMVTVVRVTLRLCEDMMTALDSADAGLIC